MFSTTVDVLSTFKSVKKKINSSFPEEHCETSPSNIANNTEAKYLSEDSKHVV